MSIRLGEWVYVGAGCILVGCDLPSRTIVGAGSVVTKSFSAEPCGLLIAGNPASIRKRYDDDLPPAFQPESA
jgi:acetyltransferase-like isoleucine patch superfamily enzyme